MVTMGNFYFWLAESFKIFTNDEFQVFYEDSYCNLVPMKKKHGGDGLFL